MWKKTAWCLAVIIILPSISALQITEFELNPAGSDPGNEWLELYSDEEINLSEYKLINADGNEFQLNQTFSGYLIITFPVQWLDNSEEGITIMNKDNNTIFETEIKSDSYNDERTWQFCNGEWIFFDSTKGFENCEEEQNNETDEDNKTEKQEDSSIEITKAPSSARFGEIIMVEAEIYRGDTGKYAVYAYISGQKTISETTTFHANDKFTEYDLTIPIAIKNNCVEEEEREYNVVMEGLGEKDSKNIFLQCTSQQETPQEEKVINASSVIITGKTTQPYSQNKTEQVKWLLLITCLIIIVALIIKKLE